MSVPTFTPEPQAPVKKKSTLKVVLITLAAITAVVIALVAGCTAMVGSAVNDVAKSMPTAASTDAPAEDPTNTQDPADTTPVVKVGEAVTIDGAEGAKATMELTKISDISKDCQMPELGCDKPEHGKIWAANFTIKSTGSSNFHVNAMDWRWTTADGGEYDTSNGSSLFYGDPDKTLSVHEVRPGKTLKGTIVFDAEKSLNDASIVYSPAISADPVAEWLLTS